MFSSFSNFVAYAEELFLGEPEEDNDDVNDHQSNPPSSPASFTVSNDNEHFSDTLESQPHEEDHEHNPISLQTFGGSWASVQEENQETYLTTTAETPVPSNPGSERSLHSNQEHISHTDEFPLDVSYTEALPASPLLAPPAVTDEQEIEGDILHKSSESEPERGPKGKSKEADAEASPSKEPQDHTGVGDPSEDDIYISSSEEEKPNKRLSDEPWRRPQTTPTPHNVDWRPRPPLRRKRGSMELGALFRNTAVTPEQKKKGTQQPATQSHTGSFDFLVNSPMRDQDGVRDKEIDETQEPSPAGSNASKLTAIHLASSGSNRPEVPDNVDKREPSPPPSPGSGQETFMSPRTPQAPIFITMGDADDARFAPFLDEEGSPVLGESLADIIARDQIRRSEAVLERPLTDEQKEVIRSYYQETGHRRAPDEVSEQGTVHSLSSLEGVESPPRSNIASGGSGSSRNLDRESSPPSPSPSPLIVDPPVPHQTPSDETIITEHANEGAAAQLRDRIQAFEAQLAEAKQQRTSDQEQHAASQRLLDTACVDIARLQQEQRATEKRMATLESELNKTVKVELKKLRARRIREDADAEAEAEATTSLRRRQARNLECTQPHHIRLQRAGWSNLTAVTFAMVLLVWVVTEAMLHSKRLSDGYGPFINGGYNGLGSVVIFGTWGKFLLFILAMVYLGVLSVLAAMGW